MGVLWLRLLRETNDKMVDIPPEFLEIPELRKAMELTQESSYTRAELEAYDGYWDAVSREKSKIVDAKVEGMAMGREEGREEGRKALEEEKKKMALKMLKEGMDVETVGKVTGLSYEKIKSLI
jgi:predicted transposase/invertase (TIGR01784 family)